MTSVIDTPAIDCSDMPLTSVAHMRLTLCYCTGMTSVSSLTPATPTFRRFMQRFGTVGSGTGNDFGVRQRDVPASRCGLLLYLDKRQAGAPDAGTLPSQGTPEGAQEISPSRPGEVSSQDGRSGSDGEDTPESGDLLWVIAAPLYVRTQTGSKDRKHKSNRAVDTN